LGKGKQALDRCLLKDRYNLIAYIDNYKAKDIKKYDGIPVVRLSDIDNLFDVIVVTLMQYQNIKLDLINKGIPQDKIVCFYSFEDAEKGFDLEFIDVYKWRSELMWKHYTEVTIPTINNFGYELYADYLIDKKQIPSLVSVESTVELVKNTHKSLARFGDNEFELILGRRRTNYQEVDSKLSSKLIEVLNSKLDNLLIAIADNYGHLDKYTDEAATAIRQYLGNGTREEHMRLLDLDRVYFDAYLSRPYIMYRDKDRAKDRIKNIQEIWKNQDILIVEGEHTRFGVGNDLLENARTVQRLLTLDRDCFSVYDNLLDCVKEYGHNKLIMIILGPVATIMAYDLAQLGYWAIDIGQLDVEYEWCLRKVKERCDIPYKTVSEVLKYDEIMTDTDNIYIKKYQNEIIKRVIG